MVLRYIEELTIPAAPPNLESEDEEPDEDGTEFLDILESLREPRTDDFQGRRLHKIAMEARASGREATLQKISLYLREILPAPQQPRNREGARIPSAPRNKREARRREYGRTQAAWTKDRSRCINDILEPMGNINQPPREIMEPFWKNLMSTGGDEAPQQEVAPIKEGIWRPIGRENLRLARISYNSAPRPDGTTACQYRAIPSSLGSIIYSCGVKLCQRICCSHE